MKRGAIAIVVMLLFLGCERSDIDEKSLKLASFESHTLYMILESLIPTTKSGQSINS